MHMPFMRVSLTASAKSERLYGQELVLLGRI